MDFCLWMFHGLISQVREPNIVFFRIVNTFLKTQVQFCQNLFQWIVFCMLNIFIAIHRCHLSGRLAKKQHLVFFIPKVSFNIIIGINSFKLYAFCTSCSSPNQVRSKMQLLSALILAKNRSVFYKLLNVFFKKKLSFFGIILV